RSWMRMQSTSSTSTLRQSSRAVDPHQSPATGWNEWPTRCGSSSSPVSRQAKMCTCMATHRMIGNEMMTAKEVLDQFADEDLPEFVGLSLNDVNRRGNFGDYPLHVACMRGNLEQATALLAGGALVNAIGDMEYLPIHLAIYSGNHKLVELLVQTG